MPTDASSSSSHAANYSPPPPDSQGNTTIFVGGLSLSRTVTESDLFSIFKVHGPIHAIRILPKGCGFVVYQFRNDADRALNTLNGASLGAITNGGLLRLSWGKNEGRPLSASAKKGEAMKGGANSSNSASSSSSAASGDQNAALSNNNRAAASGLRGGSAISAAAAGGSFSVSKAEIERAAAAYFSSDYSDPLSSSSSTSSLSNNITAEDIDRLQKKRERFVIEFARLAPVSTAMSGRQLPELPFHLMEDDFTPP